MLTDRTSAQRRTLRVLIGAQILSGAGLAAGVTVGALLAQDMLGSTSWAGVPAALLTAGSAVAALAVGRLSNARGRRPGLAAGYAAGALGSLGIVAAGVLDNTPLLFAALLVYGSGSATNLQARYAGADLARPDKRAQAIGAVLVATTVGAVAGPMLVGPLAGLANAVGIPALTGPFLLAAIAYGAAAVFIAARLRPDPLLLAKACPHDENTDGAVDGPQLTDRRAVLTGAVVMVTAQLVMTAVMTMTPVHMRDHHLGLSATGLVIALHIAAMYAPAPVSGALVDRFGATAVGTLAAVVLATAGVTGALVPAHSAPGIAVALILLGFGWSLGLVTGTALVTANTAVATRAVTQGSVDVWIALAGAAGGLLSGLVMAATSFAWLGLACAAIAIATIPLLRTATACARS